MILHIVPDDKFIDMAYNTFEKASPGNNIFLVISKTDNYKYIKKTPVKKISPSEFLSKRFANSLVNYEFVVLHWLDDFKKQLILNAPKSVKFLWIGWGGDYYCYINKELLLPETKELYKRRIYLNKKKRENFVNLIKSKIWNILYFRKINDIERILEKINYFAPVLEEDYTLVKESFKDFKPKYIDWNYGTLEDDLIKNKSLMVSGDNILIGNSATLENNHLDVFKILQKLDLKERKLICPLSYGDLQYANFISLKGKELFGSNFKPIIDFLPIEEYNKLLSTCSIAIMNHLRQQALGNIVIMLYLGAKVFLNKENPVYWFFKRNGAIVYSMEELTQENIEKGMNEQNMRLNREILNKYWSRDVIIRKTKELIAIINNGEL